MCVLDSSDRLQTSKVNSVRDTTCTGRITSSTGRRMTLACVCLCVTVPQRYGEGMDVFKELDVAQQSRSEIKTHRTPIT